MNIHSQTVFSLDHGSHRSRNHIQSNEIYHIALPDNSQPVRSSKAVAEQTTFSPDAQKLLVSIDHDKLFVRETKDDFPFGDPKALAFAPGEFRFPQNLEFIQAPYHVFVGESKWYAPFNRDVYYLEVPRDSLLVYTAARPPGLHLYNLGYRTSFKFFKTCADPSKDLRIGGKGRPNTVTFNGKTMVFPRPVDFA